MNGIGCMEKITGIDDLFVELEAFDQTGTERETIVFLLHMLDYLRPKTIIEAGTYKGHFAVPAARLAKEWGGIIHTWDPTIYAADLPQVRNMVFYQEDYNLETLPAQADFAFVDSGPPQPEFEAGMRWRHYQHTLEHMAPGGIVVTHDMNSLAWTGGPEIYADADLILKAGRGIAIKQVR
jgi:predicted O-methyltransferase YrrM